METRKEIHISDTLGLMCSKLFLKRCFIGSSINLYSECVSFQLIVKVVIMSFI